MAKALTSKSGFIRPTMLAGVPIEDHDGLPITDCAGNITGLQGGFSESARMEMIHVPVGSKVVGVWWGEAVSHEYDRVEEGRGKDKVTLDEFKETTVYKADAALLIDPDDLEMIIAKHNTRVADARAAAAAEAKALRGELPLPFGSDDEAGEGDDGEGDGDPE